MKKTVYVGLAIAALVIGLTLSPLEQYKANAAMEGKIMMQKLTNTNVPITRPLTKGYVNGFEVFYVSTEASDKDLADHLTKVTGARVAFAPALALAPAESLANIYAFKNGISGSGPLGFQPNVADSQPGDARYSPLWRVNVVEWKSGVAPRELKSENEIIAAQANKELTITPTKLVVNCPFVKWHEDALKIRSDKTLTDETQYGGGQVLDINTEKMTVTFVAHRGFAPDGATIYYIATDASVKDVADALGVVFVQKTEATLRTGASSDLYVFTNGIKGTGPLGFQASIASTNVGNDFYSPLWRIQATTWKDASQAEFLTKLADITSAGSSEKLTTDVAGVVVNCPFVVVSEETMMEHEHAMMEHSAMEHTMMTKLVSIRGDLTSPSGDKPFGGDHIGSYSVRAKGERVMIIANVQIDPSQDKVREGWLVDVQSGYKLSIGQLDDANSIVFKQKMVNPWIYDLLVITEEPVGDTNPNPDMPIGGAQLVEPFGK